MAELAAIGPVVYSTAHGGHWIITRYKEIHDVLTDTDNFSSYPNNLVTPADFGRFIPLLRSFVSFAAGLAEMAFAKFLVFTVVGCAVWCTALSLIGYSVGGTYDHVQRSFTYASYLIAAIAIAAVALLIWHRLRTMRAERS